MLFWILLWAFVGLLGWALFVVDDYVNMTRWGDYSISGAHIIGGVIAAVSGPFALGIAITAVDWSNILEALGELLWSIPRIARVMAFLGNFAEMEFYTFKRRETYREPRVEDIDL